ncbi:MAG: corrinoid protein [Phycisphaeraceae bacterium]|nr:corrinoid protein [Phycisphaeraceae bacterium]
MRIMDFKALNQAVVAGNRDQAKKLTQQAIDEGVDPQSIVEQGLVPGMAIIGEKFKKNEIFVPEMMIAARAMKESLAMVEPLLTKAGIKPKYTALIGTVQGDLHDIGKNLVAMMLKGANFGVVDLGINVTPQKFVDAAKEHKPNVIGLSALLTTTMPAMKTTIEALKQAGVNGVKVMIGGAPITQQYADEIGADGYAPDAASAVDLASQLVSA